MRPLRCFSSPNYTAVLPDGHVFPMSKFARSAALVAERDIGVIIDPGSVSDRDLLRVHRRDYVRAIDTGAYDAITAQRLGLPWHSTIPTRSRAATAGTMAAMRAAFDDGIACNLAGGTHHAFADHGEGFCVFNDVAVAIRALQADEPLIQVMVVDLDAHQGNGTNALFANDPNVFTYSMHVGRNYPSTKVPGSLDVELPRYVSGNQYLDEQRRTLPPALETFEPDIVFFNAGVDVHADDRFGQMLLSTEQIRERDAFTIDLCRGWTIPTVVVYGGGYNKTSDMTAQLHVQTVAVAADRLRNDCSVVSR